MRRAEVTVPTSVTAAPSRSITATRGLWVQAVKNTASIDRASGPTTGGGYRRRAAHSATASPVSHPGELAVVLLGYDVGKCRVGDVADRSCRIS
ncbi:hypothetical protein SAMN05444921_115194 [Streptomyces wuyuanensis]|uniref:Uncharacterized protein n=1 Tax=Streptomyces wuyuanensis TaxID=1196353 RepID=A0A1G9XDB6_9ACTN|nr:hypothetical protein SAMN05444921_115194 [Streptomyces wuyuanensis]